MGGVPIPVGALGSLIGLFFHFGFDELRRGGTTCDCIDAGSVSASRNHYFGSILKRYTESFPLPKAARQLCNVLELAGLIIELLDSRAVCHQLHGTIARVEGEGVTLRCHHGFDSVHSTERVSCV